MKLKECYVYMETDDGIKTFFEVESIDINVHNELKSVYSDGSTMPIKDYVAGKPHKEFKGTFKDVKFDKTFKKKILDYFNKNKEQIIGD